MDKFDRNVQRELLIALYEASPEGLSHHSSRDFEQKFGGKREYVANLRYLEGHGLLTFQVKYNLSVGYEIIYEFMAITSKGIDFVRNDGGLGAILNVVNVRLHSDTINKLESIIGSSGVATEEEKSAMISTLRKLPEDAIKHLNLKLLDMGLARLPDAFHAIQTALHGLL